jgi:FMN-dependent NADH-azoreductase
VKILHLSFSSRGPASESIRLASEMLDHLFAIYPHAVLVERMLGDEPLPHIDANYALAQHLAIATAAHHGSIIRSEEAIRTLQEAGIVVISTPVHNLTVPSALKAWLDHVVRVRRTFDLTSDGKKGMLHDRPVFIVVASGGRLTGDRARQPDFLTPYLQEVLKMVGLRDVHFFHVEGTGAPEEIVEKARESARMNLERFFDSFAELGGRRLERADESARPR